MRMKRVRGELPFPGLSPTRSHQQACRPPMKPTLYLLRTTFLFFTLAGSLLSSSTLAKAAEPYGRACLTALSASEDSGNGQAEQETVFDQESKPSLGKHLKLYLDANSKCVALIAAFDRKDAKLTNGWRPRLVDVQEWEEKKLPPPTETWDWTTATGAFDFYVVFLGKDSSLTQEIKTLVASMKDPKAEPKLLQMQTKRLHDQINQWLAGKNKVLVKPGSSTHSLGGIVRAGDEFPWRDASQKVEFNEKEPGIVVFEHAED